MVAVAAMAERSHFQWLLQRRTASERKGKRAHCVGIVPLFQAPQTGMT